jgi:CubicO group peptidase (beta-lactamase class C family)
MRYDAPRMARLLAAALAALALALLAPSSARGDGDPAGSAGAPRDIASLLEPVRAAHDVPALAGAIVSGGRTTALGATGRRRRDESAPVTSADRFHVGSCTKSMTATLAALLVEEGRLAWETTVGDVFARRLGPDALRPAWRGVTLAQLLVNRGGAPANLDADGLWGRLWALDGPLPDHRRALVRGVLARDPEAPPGTKFIYSNAGFSIAGAMLEERTGRAYEDLIRERLFAPLGMETAGFGAPGERGRLDEPRGHGPGRTPTEPGPAGDNPPAISPAGRVHASIGDWAKYAALHLSGARAALGIAAPGEPAPRLLRPGTYSRLHTPPVGEGSGYAMGWGTTERPWGGGTVLTHNGSNTMWFAVIWLAPRRDLAVLAACNEGGTRGEQACDRAAWALIQAHYAGKAPEER